VLYGYETWSLTLREEHRLRVFENRVFRRIFGPKREEDGSWIKFHNDVTGALSMLIEFCFGEEPYGRKNTSKTDIDILYTSRIRSWNIKLCKDAKSSPELIFV
jgi:hypothetical protein